MDIRQLRYFIAIAEEKKITAAAKRLHMAQPPLSQQLRLMEQELGVPLVERRGKKLELTKAGQTLYKHALEIAHLMDESQMEVKEIGNGIRGKLAIGVNTLSWNQLPKLLRTFQEMYPKMTYKIQQNESAQLCKMVRERVIEMAVVWFPLELSDFAVLHLKTEPFCFVAPSKFQLDSDKISYEEMKHCPLILPSTEGLGVYSVILEELSQAGLQDNIICECSDLAVLFELVSSGFGSAIIPESVLKLHKGYDIRVFELADAKRAASSGLIWLKDHYLSKAAQNFIGVLRQHDNA
ncbi:LysR family transcriptional regulator [Brevibacillus sp. B_LB10_24]|uniref:LysR family transcriptional regulator n=1 Tax=Brevibacillus sp. B_LB10_24 TaxID=3380645 RepID=UPI0038B7FA58